MSQFPGGPGSPSRVLGPLLWHFDLTGVLWTTTGRTVRVVNDADPIGRADPYRPGKAGFGQATAGKRPLYKTAVVNGLAVARFDGVDDWLDGDLTPLTSKRAIWAVAKQTATAAILRLFSNCSTSAGYLAVYTTNPSSGGVSAQSAFYTADDATSYDGAWKAFSAESDGFDVRLYVNGVLKATAVLAAGGAMAGEALGSNVAGTQPYKGDIADAFAIGRIPTADERAAIQAYLADRFAL